MTKRAHDHEPDQKTKISAIANDVKTFRDKLNQGGLTAEDKSLLDKIITELDGLYDPARSVRQVDEPKG